MRSAFVYRSHDWMHSALLGDAAPPTTFRWAQGIDDADVILYPVSPWHDDPPTGAGLRPLLRCLDRIFLYSTHDRPVIWAPGAFTSVRQHDARSRWATGAGYVLAMLGEPRTTGREEEPTLLWSFIGSVDTCPDVRSRVVAVRDDRALTIDTAWWSDLRWEAEGDPARRSERRAAIDRFAASLAASVFVVCPRGRGPSSYRIYETMRAGRCPVIVADDWVAPLGIDWSSCAIQVPESDIESLPQLLREREPEGRALGEAARQEWQSKLSAARLVHSLVEGCFSLQQRGITRLDRIRLAAGTALTADAWRQARTIGGVWSRSRRSRS